MKQKEGKFRHQLEADERLQKKIEVAMKKHRPYMDSRNAFICNLIVLGLEKLEDIEKRK